MRHLLVTTCADRGEVAVQCREVVVVERRRVGRVATLVVVAVDDVRMQALRRSLRSKPTSPALMIKAMMLMVMSLMLISKDSLTMLRSFRTRSAPPGKCRTLQAART